MIDPFNLKGQVDADTVRVIRQSTLGTADKCLKRLEYEFDPTIPYGTGEARIQGTAYHAGLEHYYRLRMNDWEPGALSFSFEMDAVVKAARVAFEGEIKDAGPDLVWETSAEKTWLRVVKMLEAYFENQCQWPVDYEVLGVEETILMPFVDGWVMKGTLDLILRDPNGWIIIVDHKTAKKAWAKDKHTLKVTNQPSWYTYWAEQIYETTNIQFVFDIMQVNGTFERRLAPVSAYDKQLVVEKAHGVCRLVEGEGPYLPTTDFWGCSEKWCDHFRRCPWGEARETGVIATLPTSVSSQEAPQEDVNGARAA